MARAEARRCLGVVDDRLRIVGVAPASGERHGTWTAAPKWTLGELLRNKGKLKAVLLYHVVRGKATSADVAELSSAKTLNGKSVRIRVSGSDVYVNSARVTKPHVMASNGVIHVVNRVLIPR